MFKCCVQIECDDTRVCQSVISYCRDISSPVRASVSSCPAAAAAVFLCPRLASAHPVTSLRHHSLASAADEVLSLLPLSQRVAVTAMKPRL